jgi:hypothetical protein
LSSLSRCSAAVTKPAQWSPTSYFTPLAAAPACPAFFRFSYFPNRTVRQPDKLFTRTLKEEEEEDEDESLSLFFILYS